MRFANDGLGRRIVTLMILASVTLSFLAAGVQLWTTYQRDLGTVLSEFEIVQDSFFSGLENALWQFNFDQVEVLLDGILAQADVVMITLQAETGHSWQRGAPTDATSMTREFALVFEGQEPTELGSLTVTLTLEHIRARLFQQFWTLLASNFLKTIAATFVMLLIFERMVARHLRKIANATEGGVWETGQRRFELDRSENGDELDQIVSSLNEAGLRIQQALSAEEERRREQETLNDQLRQANREQAEFTYAISHDLKSPSNTISMLLEELAELRPDDEEVGAVLTDMSQTNARMRALVDDILDYSQTVEARSTDDQIDLETLVHEITADLSGALKASGGTVQTQRLPVVRGNATQLRVLFQNLIANAIKFQDPSRPPLVKVTGNQNGRKCAITVSDNGIGIPEEHREKVFGLFQRLHTRDEFEGTGLGLTVCRRIMSNHQGTIELKSNDPFGTVVDLEFWKGVQRD